MAGTAALLANETKGLLMGEAASRDVVSGICDIVRRARNVTNELRTMHLAPYEILLALSIDFVGSISSEAVERCVSVLGRPSGFR